MAADHCQSNDYWPITARLSLNIQFTVCQVPPVAVPLLRTHWLLFLGWTNTARPPSTTIEIVCFSVALY